MFMIITEDFSCDNAITRWYYGTYNDRNMANDIAADLGNGYPYFHTVIPAEDAESLGVLNLPQH